MSSSSALCMCEVLCWRKAVPCILLPHGLRFFTKVRNHKKIQIKKNSFEVFFPCFHFKNSSLPRQVLKQNKTKKKLKARVVINICPAHLWRIFYFLICSMTGTDWYLYFKQYGILSMHERIIPGCFFPISTKLRRVDSGCIPQPRKLRGISAFLDFRLL